MLYSIYIRKNVRPFRLSTAYRRSNPTIKVILRNIRKTTFVTVKFMVRYYYTVVTIRSSKSLGQATIKNRFAMAEWLPQSLSFLYVRQTAGMGIRNTEIVPTELPRDYPDDKLGILDVHVRMQDGTHMNLEMQVQFFEYWDSRILFYLNKFSSNYSARSAHLLRRSYENIAPVGIQPIAKRFLMAGCHNSSAG